MNSFTKVLATLGPATLSQEAIGQLLKSGADGFRINTAHGDFKQYLNFLKFIYLAGITSQLS